MVGMRLMLGGVMVGRVGGGAGREIDPFTSRLRDTEVALVKE